MTINFQEQLKIQNRKLKKALQHLQYSYNKINNMPYDVSKLDEESLEVWESFAARFSRVSEIFLTRFLRTIALINDPGFQGTLRDIVNYGEKLGWVDDANAWMKIRELRNLNAHDYSESDLSLYFLNLKTEAPRLLALLGRLNNNASN